MKQQKNTNSVITISATSLLKKLLLLTILIALSGGDSYCAERNKYKVLITRPGKNVTTQMRVYAENEEEARENVALNGWQIISIEKDSPAAAGSTAMRGADAGDSATYPVLVTKVGEGSVVPVGSMDAPAGESLSLTIQPDPCGKLASALIDGIPTPVNGNMLTIESVDMGHNIVIVFEKNGTGCEDNGIFSKDLRSVAAAYFDLGEYNKELSENEMSEMQKLSKDKKYVVIGHTDDVKVIPNKEYADNFQLSTKRAELIKEFLTSIDIPSENIETVGLGPAFPAAENKKEGQPLNRRAIVYERSR